MRPPNTILALTRLAFRLPEPALRVFAGKTPRSDDGTPLDPALAVLLAIQERARLPKLHDGDAASARRMAESDSALVAAPPARLASVEDRFVPGPKGALKVRVYRPDHRDGLPILVFLHGGGFVVGSLETHDSACRQLAKHAGAVVVAVDYRLAPEHPYPAASDDAVSVFRFIAEHAEQLGGDRGRVGIGGDSAGGNLSAVTCQRLRDEGGPMPKAQILIYPATDLTMSLPSHERYGQGFFLDRAMIEWFRKRYFTDLERAAEVGASPLFAEDMRGLPPAVVVTAGFDPLRDEGEAYAAALESAGIAVRFRCESALIHGFINMGGICAEARAATDRIADDLAELL